MLWLLPVAGAALGYLQSREQQRAADKQRKYEATREAWSPWTGVHGEYVGEPSQIGPMMQGALAGGSMMQGIQQNQMMNKWLQGSSGTGAGSAGSVGGGSPGSVSGGGNPNLALSSGLGTSPQKSDWATWMMLNNQQPSRTTAWGNAY